MSDTKKNIVTMSVDKIMVIAISAFAVIGCAAGIAQMTGCIDGYMQAVSYAPISDDGKVYHNPYHGACTVRLIVGDKLGKSYSGILPIGMNASDGYVYRVPDGSVISMPNVIGINGLRFLGWNYGGTDVDIPADEKEIEIERDGDNDSINIYAVYANGDGDVYCSCGAYEENGLDRLINDGSVS